MENTLQPPPPATLAQVVGAVPIDFDAVEAKSTPAETTPVVEETKPPVPETTPPVAETPEPDGDTNEDDEVDPDVSEAARKLANSKKDRRSPQVRINQAVAKQREAERRAAELQAENEALKKGTTTLAPTPAPNTEGERASAAPATAATEPAPTVEQFETYEQFVAATAAHAARQENQKAEAKRADLERSQAADRAAKEAVVAHATRVDAFKAQHADFDEVITNPDAVVTDTMVRSIVESPLGPAVAYFLGQHPEESQRIAALPPMQQIRELGKLEARVETVSSPGPVRTPAKSNAPKPMTPVGGGAAASSVPLDQEDADAYIARRNADVRANGRR